MPRTTAVRAAKAAGPTPRELAGELIGIHRDNAKVFGRIDELKLKLKAAATAAGATLKEVFDGLGTVSARPATEKKFEGNLPVVAIEVWNALPKRDRDQLLKKGIVREEPQWKKAYYGSVEVKLF